MPTKFGMVYTLGGSVFPVISQRGSIPNILGPPTYTQTVRPRARQSWCDNTWSCSGFLGDQRRHHPNGAGPRPASPEFLGLPTCRLAGVYWSKGWWRWWWHLEPLVVLSSSQIITNKPTSSFFTGQMPFLSPNQQCQSTEANLVNYTSCKWLLLDSSQIGCN